MDPSAVAAILVAAFVGAAMQTAMGFGAAFTTVPMIALLAPELLPVSAIVAFLPLTIVMAWRGRALADREAVARLVVARIPGVAIGTWIVATQDANVLAGIVAVAMLLAVLAAARGWEVAVTPRSLAAVGFLAGITGTSAGLGGPPLALLYRHHVGEAMRATLAATFVLGITISLTTLSVAGQVTATQLRHGALFGIATILGTLLAAPLVARLSTARLRSGLLAWAGFGSVLALARALAKS